MSKQEFLEQLCRGLSGMPQEDVEERLTFYSEMLEDRMEEGLSEEEAVSAAGSVDEIVAQAVADIPLAKIAKERIRPKRQLNAGELILLALGSPIWLSLGIAAAAVILSLYVSVWAILVSLWAVFGALVISAVSGALGGAIFAAGGSGTAGLAMLATGLVCAGLSIFMFYGCRAATKGILVLTKRTAVWIKKCFIRKEEA